MGLGVSMEPTCSDDDDDDAGKKRRTAHSSSSVHTFTSRLRISTGWKKVSDGLVAATCTDTLLYYTPPSVGIRKKR